MNDQGEIMEWFKKHTDMVIILSAILSTVIWMNGQFNDLKKEVTIIKTVLIVKEIMPIELARQSEE